MCTRAIIVMSPVVVNGFAFRYNDPAFRYVVPPHHTLRWLPHSNFVSCYGDSMIICHIVIARSAPL